jgi:hypothetical protein
VPFPSRPESPSHRFLVTGSLLAWSMMLASCDARTPTAPEDRPQAESARLSAESAGMLGSGFLAPPPTSAPGDVSSLPLELFATVGQPTWVVVNVQGQLQMKPNPECQFTSPNWPCHPGPISYDFGTSPWDGGPVRVHAHRGEGMFIGEAAWLRRRAG